MKGVGRNPKHEGKKKGGLKVHMMIDAHSNTPAFVKISEAKQHDKNFLRYLQLAAHSMIFFDRAYNHYQQFAQWTQQHINFVCRLKSNAIYEVMKTLLNPNYALEHNLPKGQTKALLCLGYLDKNS